MSPEPTQRELHFERRENYSLVLDPLAPNWLAANEEGARALRQLRKGLSTDEVAYRHAKRFGAPLRASLEAVGRFAEETAEFINHACLAPYRGRANCLEPRRLREVWLHVTDRCNLACRHCLVSGGPAGRDGLSTAQLIETMRQACNLGADTFYFTGGEPLLREDIIELLRAATQDFGASAVVLTNGLLLDGELAGRLAELPKERLFLQVSLDAPGPRMNDALRSAGSYAGAVGGLQAARQAGLNVTAATVVLKKNLRALPALADLIAGLGVPQWHLMWQHSRERGGNFARASMPGLIRHMRELYRYAGELGLLIDNFENVRRVVNGDPHVKYDLSNACWDSLAVYRDGRVFPSACLVGIASECGGALSERKLKDIWLDSNRFAAYREKSVIHAPGINGDPHIFLHGGGDPEQAFFASNGNGRPAVDPFLPLHQAMIRQMMDETVAGRLKLVGEMPAGPQVIHMMGDDGYGCPIEAGVRNRCEHQVDFVHSNCVLIQDVIAKSRAQIRAYYSAAAREPKTEICSPVEMDRRYLSHIPEEVLARSYGCGSPVFAAGLQAGEKVLDLGSGAGMECFIAARLVGPKGEAVGVDMTDEMLDFAGAARKEVAANLGYDNVRFEKGLLEALPVGEAQIDAVISNCVINLSPEKMKVFAEIRRVLKPGGRVVISDIVSREALPAKIRFNPRLKGECIAGALTEQKLIGLLEKLGLTGVEVLKKTPWRTVEEVGFDSVTIRAWKRNGTAALLPPANGGRASQVSSPTLAAANEARQSRDCMVCGTPLVYFDARELPCHYCGQKVLADARCEAGHFVCDACHTSDHIEFIKRFCEFSRETDPLALFVELRASHLFPLHGPEHHALVPAALLTAYRNEHGGLPQPRIAAAIDRGARLPGGTCASWGGCAAALGVGIAYASLLKATPLSRKPRQAVQAAVSEILHKIARHRAPRCCRRESLLALQAACELSGKYLPHAIKAQAPPPCDQQALNRECLQSECPFGD